METTTRSVFDTLNAVNCNEHTEKKNGLTYLSWAWAWAEVKKRYPASFYTIYENAEGRPYFTDGRTCWVKTGVTIEGIEHIEYLPVMDTRNRSIPADAVTSMDMNKAIQRSLTKACARHGLGLYIYAGEDLPEAAAEEPQKPAEKPKGTRGKKTTAEPGKPIINEARFKELCEWVYSAPEGERRDARIKRAEEGYEWPDKNLLNSLRAMAKFI